MFFKGDPAFFFDVVSPGVVVHLGENISLALIFAILLNVSFFLWFCFIAFLGQSCMVGTPCVGLRLFKGVREFVQ